MRMRINSIWRNAYSRSPFGANLLLTAGSNFALAGLGMISGVLAARLLGPLGRGQLAAIQLWPMFAASLAMIGLPEALVYYSARVPDNAGRYLGSAIFLSFVAGIPFLALTFILMPQLLQAQAPGIVTASRWYLLMGPIYSFAGMLPHPLRGRGDFTAWNAMRITFMGTLVLTLIVSWMLVRTTPTFVAAGYLVAQAVLFLPFSIVIARRIPGPFLPEARQFAPMLTYGFPCVLTSLPKTLNLRLDQMLMAAFLAPQELGFYVVAVAWSAAVSPLLEAVAAVTLHSVASGIDETKGLENFIRSVRIGSAIAIVLAVLLTAVTPILILTLFGSHYRSSIRVALLLVPAGAIVGLNGIIQEGLRGMGRTYSVLYSEAIGLLVTGVLLYLLLKPYGIMGAAIASMLSYGTVTLVLLYYVRLYTGTRPMLLLVPKPSDIRQIARKFVEVASVAATRHQPTK